MVELEAWVQGGLEPKHLGLTETRGEGVPGTMRDVETVEP